MSHSYFTRFLGLVIVAVVCAPLFLTDPLALAVWYRALMVLPLLGASLMWSAMRAAPVFDDEAFHRTLPPRDGAVFRRLLRLPLGVAGGIVLVLLGYGIDCGFGWRTLLFGSVFLAVPVFCLLAGCGAAAAAATDRNGRSRMQVIAWTALLAPPVISILWARVYLGAELEKLGYGLVWPYYGRSALLGAFLYLPAWWLVAVRRKRAWGLGLAALTGLALPFLWMHDVRWQISRNILAAEDAGGEADAKVRVKRKALPTLPSRDHGCPLEQVFEVTGLAKNELLSTGEVVVGEWPRVRYDPLSDEYWAPADRLEFEVKRGGWATGWGSGVEAAMTDDGGMAWGSDAVFKILRRELPAGLEIEHWDDAQYARPGPATLTGYTGVGAGMEQPWRMQGSLLRFGKPVVLEAAKGGRVRLDGGGWLELKAMAAGDRVLELSIVNSGLSFPAGDPWFHLFRQTAWQSVTPYVVLVDDAEKTGYFIDELVPESGWGGLWGSWGSENYLGRTRNLGVSRWPGSENPIGPMARRSAMLGTCKAYVFLPESIRLPKWILEAGK